jgi:hypothetical protein
MRLSFLASHEGSNLAGAAVSRPEATFPWLHFGRAPRSFSQAFKLPWFMDKLGNISCGGFFFLVSRVFLISLKMPAWKNIVV